MKLFPFENYFIRGNVTRKTVAAMDVMKCFGLDETTSRNWCNCSFGSQFSFPDTHCQDYVILQSHLISFVRELVYANFVTIDQAEEFFRTLRAMRQVESTANIVS